MIFIQGPSDKLNYTVDWSEWLTSPDTIASVVWTVPNGITSSGPANTTTQASIVLTGGTQGVSYDVVCQITTAAGLVSSRTLTIQITQL